MSKYTREQIDKARQLADYAFDHAYDGRDDEAGNRHRGEAWINAFTETLGLEVEDEKPEPGTWWIVADGPAEGRAANVDARGWLVIHDDGGGTWTIPQHENWPTLTPARVVPAEPVELSEAKVGREFDAMNERDGFTARWVDYTNEARSQYTRIWNAALAKHGHGWVEATRADVESALIVGLEKTMAIITPKTVKHATDAVMELLEASK